MKAHLREKKAQERQFLDQLLNGKILQNYGIPVPIKADLRKYQQVCSSNSYFVICTYRCFEPMKVYRCPSFNRLIKTNKILYILTSYTNFRME